MAVRKSTARKSDEIVTNSNDPGKFCVALTSTDNAQLAQRIAGILVKKKLAACVNIVPNIQSVYRWKGEVESVCEFLLVIKTTQVKINSIGVVIKKLHTYSLPEFIVLEIKDGATGYLQWLLESVQ
jgi:periplasmic divalent cation tolerance protein